MAAKLGGSAHVAGFDDHAPQSGTVVYLEAYGEKRTLDVMSRLRGMNTDEMMKTAPVFEYTTESGTRLKFRVMHPVLLLESRVHNVLEHAKYRTEHGLRQLGASVVCAREYLSE